MTMLGVSICFEALLCLQVQVRLCSLSLVVERAVNFFFGFVCFLLWNRFSNVQRPVSLHTLCMILHRQRKIPSIDINFLGETVKQ